MVFSGLVGSDIKCAKYAVKGDSGSSTYVVPAQGTSGSPVTGSVFVFHSGWLNSAPR